MDILTDLGCDFGDFQSSIWTGSIPVSIYVPKSIGHEAALAMMQNILDIGLSHSAEKWHLVGWWDTVKCFASLFVSVQAYAMGCT